MRRTPEQMPEGDTIWRSASALRQALAGRRVVAARPAALGRLGGQLLVGVRAHGKHLYMEFEKGLVLHTHMRMTGAWHIYGRGQTWRRQAHRATAVLDFGDTLAVLFAAPLCELTVAAAVAQGLGPDILGEGFDVAEVVALARRSSSATVAEVLLDQSVCAGIGNIYRCNTLWHERVDPFTPIGDVDDATIGRLFSRARGLLRRGAVSDGFRPRAGVHGRCGRPCTTCATLIRMRPLGRPSRIVYWCPACQATG
ncbi:MAG: DNA glycosylase [Candidatus Dormibacteraeota bacterium]|uniref:DNA-(apurinic or apyrimidinic site) lyase n=1 Tax=Candidatus Amunia macphersoniae TaxID=3127014 RepID=A0A934KF64_9BACT|nr:DNA glycosylase [Candidatus Dormibacteraeota bacterium]